MIESFSQRPSINFGIDYRSNGYVVHDESKNEALYKALTGASKSHADHVHFFKPTSTAHIARLLTSY